MKFGREFQTVGQVTEKARRPKVLSRKRGNASIGVGGRGGARGAQCPPPHIRDRLSKGCLQYVLLVEVATADDWLRPINWLKLSICMANHLANGQPRTSAILRVEAWTRMIKLYVGHTSYAPVSLIRYQKDLPGCVSPGRRGPLVDI